MVNQVKPKNLAEQIVAAIESKKKNSNSYKQLFTIVVNHDGYKELGELSMPHQGNQKVFAKLMRYRLCIRDQPELFRVVER